MTGWAPRSAMRAAFCVVAHERRHRVATSHERVEHRAADVACRAGQEDAHGERPSLLQVPTACGMNRASSDSRLKLTQDLTLRLKP